jgi:polysaccharide export outer membrane protein
LHNTEAIISGTSSRSRTGAILQTYLAILTLATVLLLSGRGVGAQEETGESEKYLVNAGDQLEISVWGEEELQVAVLVRPDGGFSYPLAGDLRAAGRTVTEIQDELTQRLSRFIPNSVVTVMVTAIGGNVIYVIGQVQNPGSYVMNPQVDVMQALSMAGGTTAFADLNDIKILRRSQNNQRVLTFRYNDVARGRNLQQNVLLEAGDVVVVP